MSMGVKSMDLESLVGNVIQTTSNVGGDVGLALPLVINDAPFRGLTAGPNITLTILGDSSVEIEAAADSTTASNLGAGEGIFAQIIAGDIQFKSLIAGNNIGLVSTANDITISTTAELNTASNVGTGVDVFKQKVLVDLEFRTLLANTEVLIAQNVDDLAFSIGAIAISKITDLQDELDDRRLIFNAKRQISVYPSENTNLELIMVGAGNFTDEGDINEMFDVDGYYLEFRVTVDMGAGDGGIFCLDSVRRDLNFDVTFKFRVPAVLDRIFWAGFFTSDPKDLDIITDEHIGLRLSTEAGNVNFVISHADGVTQAETQLAVADTAIHTIRIVSDEANSKFQYSFDGAALADLTTNIPAATTDLDLFEEVYAQAGGTLPHFDFWWVDGVADA